jgi:hypothetical protein
MEFAFYVKNEEKTAVSKLPEKQLKGHGKKR